MNDMILLFSLAGRKVALRAAEVHSVFEPGDITPVPAAPAYVIGLTALRSRALTVIDCAQLLLGKAGKCGEQAIVIESDRYAFALLVECVYDVVEATGEIDPIPTDPGAGWRDFACGTVETPQGPAMVLDAAKLVGGSGAKAA